MKKLEKVLNRVEKNLVGMKSENLSLLFELLNKSKDKVYKEMCLRDCSNGISRVIFDFLWDMYMNEDCGRFYSYNDFIEYCGSDFYISEGEFYGIIEELWFIECDFYNNVKIRRM